MPRITSICIAVVFCGCGLNYYPPPYGRVISKGSDTTCYSAFGMPRIGDVPEGADDINDALDRAEPDGYTW